MSLRSGGLTCHSTSKDLAKLKYNINKFLEIKMSDDSNNFYDELEEKHRREEAESKKPKMVVSGKSVFQLKEIKDKKTGKADKD